MSSNIYTSEFWKDAGERTVSSAVLTGFAVLGGDALNVFQADWKAVGVAVLNVVVLTILKTLIAAHVGGKGTASLTSAVLPASPTGAVGEFRHEAGGTSVIDLPDTGRHHLQ